MIKPATRTTLYEEIAREIINVVKRGEWIPGERIPGENQLSEIFQVSRNCIREALKALELTGIIESRPGRGTFLTEDALRNIGKIELLWLLKNENSYEELMEIRLGIEPHLAYLAAENATEEDISRLENALEKVSNTISNKSYSMDIGIEFHTIISEIARNKFMNKLLTSINDELLAQRSALIFKHLSEEELIRELKEHEKIYEYIKNGESEKARKKMFKHLYFAKKILSKINEE